MVDTNVVSKKRFRMYIGKLNAVASLLFTLRPFLGEMHAALHAKGSKAPRTAFGLRSAPKPCLGSKCSCRAHSPDH